MDIKSIAMSIVGGIVLFMLAIRMLNAVVTGTSTSEVMLQVILPFVAAAGVIISVLIAFMAFRTGGTRE